MRYEFKYLHFLFQVVDQYDRSTILVHILVAYLACVFGMPRSKILNHIVSIIPLCFTVELTNCCTFSTVYARMAPLSIRFPLRLSSHHLLLHIDRTPNNVFVWNLMELLDNGIMIVVHIIR